MISMKDSEQVAEVLNAARSVGPFALRTPLIRSDVLSDMTGGEVLLKLENLQRTGSFKIRGAAHRIMSLTSEERSRGVVTCSSGNHGRAVAYVAERLGIDATICVPEWVDPVKLAAIERCGAAVDTLAADYDEAERRAVEFQQTRGLIFVHPFDDRHIVAGQGTVALEILAEQPDLDGILAPLSGGGLIAGIALAVRARHASCQVHAISAQNANVMAASLKAGKPVSLPEQKTIASALTGGIGLHNQHTFRLVQSLVNQHGMVSEIDIANATRLLAGGHKLVVEGGGATAVAAVMANPKMYRNSRIAIVVSGGNIDLTEWMQRLKA